MEVDHHDLRPAVDLAEQPLGRPERRVELAHEDLPLEIDRRHRHARRGLAEMEAAPGIAVGIVGRPQQARLAREDLPDLLLVPDVIAAGHAVDRQIGELGEHVRRHAEAAGGILDVDDDVIGAMLVDQARQQPDERAAPRLADHVADEENLHLAYSTARVSRITVTRIWPG